MCITASGALPSPAVPASLCPSQDEVRALGRLLGVPEQFIARHPFPGPGLAVRIIGDVTGELTFAGVFSCALALVHALGLWVGLGVGLPLCSSPVRQVPGVGTDVAAELWGLDAGSSRARPPFAALILLVTASLGLTWLATSRAPCRGRPPGCAARGGRGVHQLYQGVGAVRQDLAGICCLPARPLRG